MSRRLLWVVALFVVCSFRASAVRGFSAEQQQPPPLHVLKIAAGPAGVEEKGTFRLNEERSVFSRADDREVIVFFQWDGVPGRHLLEAVWRSPDGAYSSKSTIDYTARDRRFGAYWKLALSPSMQLGMWSIEATVDGQPGGRFTFEITDKAAPPAVAIKRPLTQQELYERLTKNFVVLARKGPGLRELEPAGGVVGPSGQIFTAVRLLDMVDRVAAVFAGGATQEITAVVDLNRAAGWAILAGRTEAIPPLPHAADRPKIGDRCYSMQGTETGARVLLEGQISGASGGSGQPDGWIVSFFNGTGVAGAPVVNEFGELLGILGRRPTVEVSIGLRALVASSAELGNVPLIPLAAIAPRPGSAPSDFAALRARGDLLEPLAGEEHIVSGGFAAETPRGTMPRPEIQRDEFSVADKEMVVFVTWGPRARLKGQTAFHLFDTANRVVASSKPAKVNFRERELATSVWRISVPRQPGIYRAELHFEGKPAWRGYVRITP